VNQNISVPVYTFNGIVPGPEIRVNLGDFVRVKVINTLSEPLTVHWHGYPVLSAMDGVSNITQDPIQSGETFTYEFQANKAGTYWYYSPIKVPDQIEGRLYGALIVMPDEKPVANRDYSLFIEEWGPKTAGLYDAAKSFLAVNGKTTDELQSFVSNKNESVRLRLINTGHFPHGIHIPGQIVKISGIEGNGIVNASEFSNQIIKINPGERIDVDFTVSCDESFFIDDHDDLQFLSQIKLPFKVLNGNNLVQLEPSGVYPLFNISDSSKSIAEMENTEKYTDSLHIDISSKWLNGNLWHFSGGKPFASQNPVVLTDSAYLRVIITNSSQIPHTFHVHGHSFTIRAINNKQFFNSVQRDIIYVNPGDTFELAMHASNPGTWIMNCPIHGNDEPAYLGLLTYKNYVSNYRNR
jgi:FtsP/CotA-like multicopper oxidase with cupredoxin domain